MRYWMKRLDIRVTVTAMATLAVMWVIGVWFVPGACYAGPYDVYNTYNSIINNQVPLVDSQGNYYGQLSNNPYNLNSTSNPYGRYGSPYSTDSINNPYGVGSPYRLDSPVSPYGTGFQIRNE